MLVLVVAVTANDRGHSCREQSTVQMWCGVVRQGMGRSDLCFGLHVPCTLHAVMQRQDMFGERGARLVGITRAAVYPTRNYVYRLVTTQPASG